MSGDSSPLLIVLPDLTATVRLAERVADLARAGDVILLEGPLGAGKTAFVRGLLRRLADDPDLEVPSPTFTLVQTYELPRLTVHHFDLWRLSGASEMVELDWDEARTDFVVVEWPDRLGALRPMEALTIVLTPTGADTRRATLAGWSDRIGALA